MNDTASLHLRALDRFAEAVAAADGKWECPSPCEGWDAHAVVEHVIGFHDVLILRPLDAVPERPKGETRRRWEATDAALRRVLATHSFDEPIEVPAIGKNPATMIDGSRLLPMLSQDLLIDAWDLARAVGANDRLDDALCERFLARMPDDENALQASGMFGAPVSVPPESDAQARLLGRVGRNPEWEAASATD